MLNTRHESFGTPSRERALTMVELLVVIVVIGILMSAVLTAGSALITKSRSNNTRAVLQVVAEAVEEFKREQTAHPTIARGVVYTQGAGPVRYETRYGLYPPDELEVFRDGGNVAPNSLAPGSAQIVIVPTDAYNPMTFHSGDADHNAGEHRDLAAMIVAIETLGDASAAILDRIPDKNRSPGAVDSNDEPVQFLDRDGTGDWSAEDLQIRYVLDDWGNPISYLAQRDWNPNTPPAASSNHAAWNEVSTTLIRLNRGQPIIMSYGPDGDEQLTADVMGNDADASLVADFAQDADGIIDSDFNNDNIYIDPDLRDKLAKEIPR